MPFKSNLILKFKLSFKNIFLIENLYFPFYLLFLKTLKFHQNEIFYKVLIKSEFNNSSDKYGCWPKAAKVYRYGAYKLKN